jgi:2-polyprenyl-6-hydroxyphenyl methylase/3-demethylubiquinone-9 3-methyltransferase
MNTQYKEFGYSHPNESHMHSRIMPKLLEFAADIKPGVRVLDVGCGNGFVCSRFLDFGCSAVGIDLSIEGIERARQAYPQGRFELVAADSEVLEKLGEAPFDLVVSTEVVEHLYAPREWAAGCFNALKPGGRLLCSTPYHGYLKNLALSLSGHWDTHANPLWDGGHIKLWSRRTLAALLDEAGFVNIEIRGAGRVPGLWMTMVAKAEKPKVI